MKVEASFVRSAAGASDLPQDGLAEIALVGRSNVGKSSLINALTRLRVARTSAAPGKTRLANVYRAARGGGMPLYLIDLPGYGYARASRPSGKLRAAPGSVEGRQAGGGPGTVEGRRLQDARVFDELTRAIFGSARGHAALLLVDSRHPGLASDRQAWQWLQSVVERCAVVATKIDKLARGERIRALRELESAFQHPVLPVSATTGEGLDELWTLIDKLANNSSNPRRSSLPRLPKGTVPRPVGRVPSKVDPSKVEGPKR